MSSASMVHMRDQHYVNGGWVHPDGTETIDVLDPATEEVIGTVPAGTAADMDAAIAAARAAFTEWSLTEPAERADLLRRIAIGLDGRADELSRIITHELGCPLATTEWLHVDYASEVFRSMAAVLEDASWDEHMDGFAVSREPYGVVGAITPWNFPLDQIVGKLAPAFAAGCTVVLKPSAVTPLNASLLAEVIDDAGLPAGVFNLVNGRGRVVGETLAGHREVDKLSFTGSTGAGCRVAELAAQTVKSVTLELGGKSASVVLDDADLEAAIKDGLAKCFVNSGQTCNAITRVLVDRSRLDDAADIARSEAETFTTGDPFQPGTRLGPLVSAAQRDQVRAYIQTGIDEGARLLTGGVDPPDGLDTGYFVRPTVFSDVAPEMTIAQEEIFGPVLALIPYEDEAEALEIANGTPYGLVANVWSDDQERIDWFARRLRAGQVYVNGAQFHSEAPFGGYKQSGIGREHGKYGLEEFLQIKATVFSTRR